MILDQHIIEPKRYTRPRSQRTALEEKSRKEAEKGCTLAVLEIYKAQRYPYIETK